jgi:hypothetical protein
MKFKRVDEINNVNKLKKELNPKYKHNGKVNDIRVKKINNINTMIINKK